MYYEEDDYYDIAYNYVASINYMENNINLRRTIVVGDFNMNPFSRPMISASGFNAVSSKYIAQNIKRKVKSKDYMYFYNPMWNLFGDLYKKHAGTYYYNISKPINYQWHIFDQVIIRPELIDNFIMDHLKILDSDGSVSLVDQQGKPDTNITSDHLPIVFSLKF
jgi:hypothetical protein